MDESRKLMDTFDKGLVIAGVVGGVITVGIAAYETDGFKFGPRAKFIPSTLDLDNLPAEVVTEIAGFNPGEELSTSITDPEGFSSGPPDLFNVDQKGRLSTFGSPNVFVVMRNLMGILIPPKPDSITFRFTSTTRAQAFAEATIKFVGGPGATSNSNRNNMRGTHVNVMGLHLRL